MKTAGYKFPKPGRRVRSRTRRDYRTGETREVLSLSQWQARRMQALERDQYRCRCKCKPTCPQGCQECGCGVHLVITYFETDHFDERGMGGSNRNDALPNLRSVNPWCHAKIHEARRMRGATYPEIREQQVENNRLLEEAGDMF